jgi:hypothetical protein
MILVHRSGQADGGGALHRAQAENAARPLDPAPHCAPLRRAQEPVGVIEQYLPGRRQMQALSFANEQCNADIFLELRMRVVTLD